MNKYVLALLGGIFLLGGLLYATNQSIHRLTVNDAEVWNIDEEGDVNADGTFSNEGDLRLGVSGTAETVSTTSRNSQGVKMPVVLDSASSAALEGSVLVAEPPQSDGNVRVKVGGATTDLTTVVGIAAAAGSAGSVIDMYTSGFVLALTTGTVTPGQVLTTTTSAAGYLAADATPTSGADVAVALSTGTAAGGLTKVLLFK